KQASRPSSTASAFFSAMRDAPPITARVWLRFWKSGRRASPEGESMSVPLGRLFDLTGRVGLVTGGSRGLGLQAAEALGEYGAAIALIARKEAELNETVAHLATLGISAYPFIADLSSADAVDGVVERIMVQFGRIDVLVNNAGATWG